MAILCAGSSPGSQLDLSTCGAPVAEHVATRRRGSDRLAIGIIIPGSRQNTTRSDHCRRRAIHLGWRALSYLPLRAFSGITIDTGKTYTCLIVGVSGSVRCCEFVPSFDLVCDARRISEFFVQFHHDVHRRLYWDDHRHLFDQVTPNSQRQHQKHRSLMQCAAGRHGISVAYIPAVVDPNLRAFSYRLAPLFRGGLSHPTRYADADVRHRRWAG